MVWGVEDMNVIIEERRRSDDRTSFDLIFMMLMGIRTAVGKFANVHARDVAVRASLTQDYSSPNRLNHDLRR